MKITLDLIEKKQPLNQSQYGNYLCVAEHNGEKKVVALSWGMRGWFEKGIGCYGDDGEKVIAHAYLDDIVLNLDKTTA